MSEKKIDAFGIVGFEPSLGVKADEKFLDQFDIEFDKETGNTKVVKVGKINLVEQIQTYKDDCGLELMKKMLAQGTDPAVFADDGSHGGDTTLPHDLNTAYAVAQEAKAKADAVAAKIGATDYAKVDDIQKYVLEALQKIQSQQATKVVEDVKEGESK